MLTTKVMALAMDSSGAPQLDITVSPGLQTMFRGIAIVLIVVLLVMLLVKNLKFGRGGMGGGGRIGAKTIIVTLLVAAMLMDVDLFVAFVNWIMVALWEVKDWIADWLDSSGGGSGGEVTVS